MNIKEKELALAKEIFARHGYAGKTVYIPTANKRREDIKKKI